ncbi:MAG: addiction module protein [Bacteroidia bacterium]
MAELVEQILSLPKAVRLKIAMQILLSIQEEESNSPDWHLDELDKFQKELSDGKVKYYSEEEFWAEARKRVS